jgi:predicted nucleotidyltransferase
MMAARKAADLLRREFGANGVFVFGSLARRGEFTPWSDVDLAAFGIPPSRFFEAVGAVTGLSSEFKVDLVDIDTCPLSMREAIETEGKSI